MSEFTKSEMRIMKRAEKVDISLWRRWSCVVGILTLVVALVEITFWYTVPNYPVNFWMIIFLLYFGGSLIETAGLYSIVRKLRAMVGENQLKTAQK